MSAPAIKSSMPGVGASPSSTGHSVLPMNIMAQKVVSGTESNSGMKPMNTGGLSYVTLQPPNHPQQPLSLVQDHRPPVYQAQQPTTYSTNNAEKETESEKIIANGVESSKPETEQEQNCPIKSNEPSRNNNMSPETPSQEQQTQDKKQLDSQSELEAIKPDTTPVVSTSPQSKPEEKKSPVNNGTKETEAAPATPGSSPNKLVAKQKLDDAQAKSEAQKPKVPSPIAKPSENTATISPKSETKVTTTARATKRKPKELKDLKGTAAGGGGPKPKRNRIKTQPYQSPLPEIAMIVKTLNKPVSTKAPDDKLIVFYKNEFLAVRNTEGSFFVCQAMQNIYKSSKRIRIRWLSQDKNNGEIYSPDFYDHTDFDCILTNLNLNKVEKNKYQLTKLELLRTENILKRAIDVEAGVSEKPRVTEEHPDGLDLSLFKDESQLKKRKSSGGSKQKRQRKKTKRESSDSEDDDSEEDSEEDEKPEPKANAVKKRTNNKALAIAKSMAKGPSRKERVMNRRNKIAAEEISSASAGKSDSAKKTAEVKKDDPKKAVKPQSNNNSGIPRTKARAGAMQKVQESKSTTSRPKRVLAATTGVQPNTEEASSRKKSRGRA